MTNLFNRYVVIVGERGGDCSPRLRLPQSPQFPECAGNISRYFLGWLRRPVKTLSLLPETTQQDEALVEEAGAAPRVDEGDERRRYYRVTALGLAVARAEAERLAELVGIARAKDLLPERGT